MIGQTLSHFKVIAAIGEGGMGKVYRATDTKLNRDVAIKFLPDEYASDSNRLARLEREARLLASLNHPHIATIHGLEEVDGARFIVMELVQGDPLDRLLASRAIGTESALEICRQVADALAIAHEQGIIHRDLKPSNVMVSKEGRAKVLDFGLAKEVARSLDPAALAMAETESRGLTSTGKIVGSTPYMSPEQLRGENLDQRTDIWSFGCLLYEALTGNAAFGRATAADTVSAIVEQEPDWAALPPTTPPRVRTLLRRCLQKEEHRRLRDVGDARIELEDLLAAASAEPGLQRPPGLVRRYRLWAWVLVAAAVLSGTAAGLGFLLAPSPAPPATARLTVVATAGGRLDIRSFSPGIALSPDGSLLAFVANDDGPETRLYLRPIDDFAARAIPGTEGATGPFFSPDGQWLGFFAGGRLLKVRTSGGAVKPVCEVPRLATGASWGPADDIVFASFGSGLMQVSASGGTPVELTKPQESELGHAWPQILSDGSEVLFTLAMPGRFDVAVLSRDSREWRTVVSGSSWGRVLPNGLLLHLRQGEVLAERFNGASNARLGAPVPILEKVFTSDLGVPYLAVSDTGTLAYVEEVGTADKGRLVLVDREGTPTPLLEDEDWYSRPRFSPDGKKVAVQIRSDIWIIDKDRSTRTRLTHGGENVRPVWSPDGQQIAFASDRAGSFDLYSAPADGSREPALLYAHDYPQWPVSWSPDGRDLIFCELNPSTGGDIGALPVGETHAEGARIPTPLLVTPPDTPWATVSQDGRWLAYVSDESGRGEVYVKPHNREGERWTVSTDGGDEPLWAPDGRGLFYRSGDRMMFAALREDPTFSAEAPSLLFEGSYAMSFDFSADGDHFVMVMRPDEPAGPVTGISVVLGWLQELDRRLTRGR